MRVCSASDCFVIFMQWQATELTRLKKMVEDCQNKGFLLLDDKVRLRFQKMTKRWEQYKVKDTESGFLVKGPRHERLVSRHEVSPKLRCTCLEDQQTGEPCVHIFSVVRSNNKALALDARRFIPEFFADVHLVACLDAALQSIPVPTVLPVRQAVFSETYDVAGPVAVKWKGKKNTKGKHGREMGRNED
jgi:hypothetical protein